MPDSVGPGSRPNRPRPGLNTQQETFIAYLLCLPSVALAAAFTATLRPLLGYTFFELFQLAVVITSFYGGIGPGVATATVSFLFLDYFFISPYYSFSLGTDFAWLAIFYGVALVTSTLSGRLRNAKRQIELANDELENRVATRTTELAQVNRSLTEQVTQRLNAEKALLEISAREQRRLGQDLHDGLCQILVGTRLLVEELEKRAEGGQVVQREGLEKISNRLTDALSQADAVSRGLYPVELETNGLMEALEEMTINTSAYHGVDCRLRSWESVDVTDSAVATHLYRIAQEAVMNAIKGGRARRISVRIIRRGEGLVLRITDNGIGLVNAEKRNGMGLRIMEYRARVIDADLRFWSRRAGGTVVSCVWKKTEVASGEKE